MTRVPASEDPAAAEGSPAGDGPSLAGPRRKSPHTTRRTVMTAAAAAVLGSVSLDACDTPSSAQAPSASGTSTATGQRTTTTPSTPGSPTGIRTGSGGAAPAVLESTGADIQTGPSGAPRVALTFHGAGPAELTLRVLDIARAHGAKVTVFAVGVWLHANPRLGRAILAGGHDLGNHTYTHQPMRRLTPAEADLEVSRGAAAVAAVRGSAGLLFRPSGTQLSTATIRAAALAAGYHRCISYDVDPRDYLDPGTAAVRDRTLAAVRAGSIVSLHLGHAGTVAALPGILNGLQQRGLSAVTVTELLGGAA